MDKRIAAALRYDETLPAPYVTATGRGNLAEKLIHAAQEYGVPVVPDGELANRLVFLETGEVVPEQLYQSIATIFTYIMSIEESVRRTTNQ